MCTPRSTALSPCRVGLREGFELLFELRLESRTRLAAAPFCSVLTAKELSSMRYSASDRCPVATVSRVYDLRFAIAPEEATADRARILSYLQVYQELDFPCGPMV